LMKTRSSAFVFGQVAVLCVVLSSVEPLLNAMVRLCRRPSGADSSGENGAFVLQSRQRKRLGCSQGDQGMSSFLRCSSWTPAASPERDAIDAPGWHRKLNLRSESAE
ncbi:MAG: hypothetical protein ACK55Z_36455, partial [bacterium]